MEERKKIRKEERNGWKRRIRASENIKEYGEGKIEN